MQTTISFTDQDDKAAVADLLIRLASALSSTSVPAVLSHAGEVVQGSTDVGEQPAKRTRTSKKPDPVEAYNAIASVAGAAPVVEASKPAAEVSTPAAAAPATAPVTAPAAAEQTLADLGDLGAIPEPEDRKALETAVMTALNKAGMAWARENWPAGKPLRLGEFTDQELRDLRAKAEKAGAA